MQTDEAAPSLRSVAASQLIAMSLCRANHQQRTQVAVMIKVSYLELVPADVVSEFADALRTDTVPVSIERRPNTPQAAVEWLMPTAVAVFLAKDYFGAMLQEAGKEHYHALKGALKRLVDRTTGKKRDVKITTLGTEGKVLDAEPMVLSVYAELSKGRRAKFCFEHRLDGAQADEAVSALLRSLSQYQADTAQSQIALEEQGVAPGDWKPILMRFDEQAGEWLVWRWKPPIIDLD